MKARKQLSTGARLLNEYEDLVTRSEREENSEMIRDIMIAYSGTKSKKHDDLREILKGRSVSHAKLKDCYEQLVKSWVVDQYALVETKWEKRLADVLTRYSNISVLQSVVIGGHCIDIFIPGYSVAIEVNGGIHNNELKMRKDRLRDSRLMKDLGIVVMEIENQDIFKMRHRVVEFVKDQKRSDSKKVKRIWRDVYIETLCRVYSSGMLSVKLGINLQEIKHKRVFNKLIRHNVHHENNQRSQVKLNSFKGIL